MLNQNANYDMVRGPGSVKVGGVSFDRPERQTGLLAMDGSYIEQTNKPYCAVPGGGFLKFGWPRRASTSEPFTRPGASVYDSWTPWDSDRDTSIITDFVFADAVSDGVLTPMPDARDRSYGWHIDSIIDDVVTGEFIESAAPESIESDDDQSGLDDFHGHLTPCADSEITQCDCCRCKECGIKSINARSNKEPTYRCHGCSAEFEDPVLRPGQRD